MKISQLAKKFNLPTNTIRYYMSIGLLVPSSKTKQYDFSERDVKDLALILKLKNFLFSINQIQQILSLSRISNFEDKGDVKDYIKLLEEQKDFLLQQKNNITETIKNIEQEIKDSANIANKPDNISGVHLNFLEYLYCPHCNKPLDLDDASIQKQQVISGKLNCSCGYSANIKNGVVIT
ncbi:MAG: MerR family transcriptional regulator, partial [Clostridia bacterium]|nr:MerR family transcriptional regulator [Clostridia bacterium]